jgi:phage/plasmid primase-like uncharacterized protein
MTNDLVRIRSALNFISPDDRDTWVRVAMSIKSIVGEEGFADWDEWSQGSDTYNPRDARDVWKSCTGNGGITAGTLFFEASKNGWRETSEPGHPDPSTIHVAREAAKQRAQHEQAKKDRERDIAAAKAAEIWSKGTWADGHPYLTRKGVPEVATLREVTSDVAEQILGYTPQSGGTKLTGRLLVVPVKIQGRLSTLELIDESGRKTALAGGRKAGGWWESEPLPDGDGAGRTLLIGEGMATCLSAATATGLTAVATLSSGNLTAVAIELHGSYPHARIIILADLLKPTGEPDPHAIAAGKAVDCAVVSPTFKDRKPEQTDFNDLAAMTGLSGIASQILSVPIDPRQPPPSAGLIPTEAELSAARIAPRCIVEKHTFADVAQVVAPGGTGKTTLLIYESIHIALGRPLWGLDVKSTGWTLYITAEDHREQLLARLREILKTMDLTPEARTVALAGLRIWDVTGESLKLIRADNGNMVLTDLADSIVTAYRDSRPAIVIFDPLISFGASEQAVNDNEQALITAARRIVKGLDCCVRLVHHTGKGNAREGTLDQYSGRGGSALADGSRMTTVLQAWKQGESEAKPPAGCTIGPDVTLTIMARAKLSYCSPLPLIWVRREGYTFTHFTEPPKLTPEQARCLQADQIWRYLVSELSDKRRHSVRTLRDRSDELGMGRPSIERAVSELVLTGRVREMPLPKEEVCGARKTYLHPEQATQ